MTKPEAPGIDDLRQRLRSLGYLDAGVDRFVLAPAYGARGAFAIALLASLRIGILGGLLLGPAAAVGVAAQLPGLVSGVRDGVVIATYMAVLFGAGIAGLALVAGFIVSLTARFAGSSLSRRGRLLSTAAGVSVAIATNTMVSHALNCPHELPPCGAGPERQERPTRGALAHPLPAGRRRPRCDG